MKRYLILAGLILFASVASADPCYKPQAPKPCHDCETMLKNVNPDMRTNVELLMGIGSANGGDGDINTIGATLTVPAYSNLSLVGKWDHYKLEWGDQEYGHKFASALPDFESDLFSFGVKLYLP